VSPKSDPANVVEDARCRWLSASDQAATLAAELFQPGSGYGCPEAEMQDRHRLETARRDAERRYQEYQDEERRYTQQQMLQLQRSQQMATWASFCVAAAVGIATIVSVIIQVLKK
jgi:hypothetical protein